MKELMDRALDFASRHGPQYADVRLVNNRTQTTAVRDGNVETLNDAESAGFGVRVLQGGGWGFSSSCELSLAEAGKGKI